jgi:hypothetical protein
MRLLLPCPKAGLRQLLSHGLPPRQLAEAKFYTHQDKNRDIVKASKNAFASWRLGVQRDRFEALVGHALATLSRPLCRSSGRFWLIGVPQAVSYVFGCLPATCHRPWMIDRLRIKAVKSTWSLRKSVAPYVPVLTTGYIASPPALFRQEAALRARSEATEASITRL